MPNYTVNDLALAYRKAKVDLLYSSDRRPLDLLRYEENLNENLENLVVRLNGHDDSWLLDPEFLGSYRVIPKGLSRPNGLELGRTTFVSSPQKKWDAMLEEQAWMPEAEFRLYSRCSIDMHILSALWAGKVGAIFDERLPDSVRGYRLRRRADGQFNWYSVGTFKPYFSPYGRWRDDGFDAMTTALDQNRSVIAVTADVESFFPNIDASFMVDDQYLADVLEIDGSEFDMKLHRQFVLALECWRVHLSDLTGLTVTGLPLGLSASSIIANLAMIEFDRLIATEIRPRYYGRYVDDVILVLDDVEGVRTASEIWSWIAQRFNFASSSAAIISDGGASRFEARYLVGSNIKFANEKNRIFFLDGETGKDVIRSIRATISARSSEWRAVPELPVDAKEVGPQVARADSIDGDPADSLRATGQISAGRARFALTLRDFEAHARDLDPGSWADHRHAFFSAVREHILVPQVALDMDQYVARVLEVAIVCGDWEDFHSLASALVAVHVKVTSSLKLTLKSVSGSGAVSEIVTTRWADHLKGQIVESLAVTACVGVPDEVKEKVRALLGELDARPQFTRLPQGLGRSLHRRLFARDLAYQPFRNVLFPEELRSGLHRHAGSGAPRVSRRLIPRKLREPLRELAAALSLVPGRPARHTYSELRNHSALVFPTRPLAAAEVFALTRVLSPTAQSHPTDLRRLMFATRGHPVTGGTLSRTVTWDKKDSRWIVRLPRSSSTRDAHRRPRVAITMFDTSDQAWSSSVHRSPDLSLARWNILARLVNDVLTLRDLPDYLVLGELSLPPTWFFSVSRKLAAKGISLVAGVEYIHHGGGTVHNQVWAALVHDALGFESIAIYRQDKQRAAHGERRELASSAGLEVAPAVPWKRPPLIHHGDLWMALLVCSELTNIDHRSSLRGRVDVLIVPEWNQDLNTFEPLVESAALDLHSYVVQVNTRHYGDSRVRGPMELAWERDIARVRGGGNDYVVVVDLDVRALRSFQSQLSAVGPFKPLPDGFKISKARRRVPEHRPPAS